MAQTQTVNAADGVIRFASAQIGKPYAWAAEGPNAYDCSGLVWASYKSVGITVPRTTGLLITAGHGVSKAELAPGDLVFPNPGHVQIYVGGGRVIEAPTTGIPVRNVPMWGFWRARRIVAPGSASSNVSDATQGFGNPVSAVGDSIDAVIGFLGKLTDKHMWLRVGMFIAGFILLGTSLFNLDVKSVAKGVVSNGTR
jgi:uncharacterized protein YycO